MKNDGYMVRFKRRGTSNWFSAMEDGKVRFFATDDEAHEFKEMRETKSGVTHTFNVYPYDASAM